MTVAVQHLPELRKLMDKEGAKTVRMLTGLGRSTLYNLLDGKPAGAKVLRSLDEHLPSVAEYLRQNGQIGQIRQGK